MNALFHIILKSAKNSLKDLVKKKGKLALYIIIAAVIIGLIFISVYTRQYIDSLAPMFWFTMIMFIFIVIFTVIAVINGLSNGDAIFYMNDVNLLFISPVNSRHILLYGVVRTAKTAFLAGFFILFQTTSFSNFGIGFGGVLLIFGSFILSVIVLTIISLFIYSFSNGNIFRKRIVKISAVAFFLPLAVFIIMKLIDTQDIIVTAQMTAVSPFLKIIPVAGWTASALNAFFTGNLTTGFLFLGLNLFLGAGILLYIMNTNPDYYEDVLVAAETAYEKKRALAEGNISAVVTTAGNIKVTKTGINGTGASALFGKHIRESFRQNHLGFLNHISIMYIAGAVIFSLIICEIMVILQVLMWSYVFLIGTGRGLRETYSHYIYMIPETSFKKIIWSNMEIMIKSFSEGVLIFTVCGIIIRENPSNIIICIAVFTLFSFLLLGINFVFMRFTGTNISAGFLMMIYFLAVAVVMVPGIVLAVVLSNIAGENSGFFTGLTALSLWELLAGICCFALSGGILNNCDMPVYKTEK